MRLPLAITRDCANMRAVSLGMGLLPSRAEIQGGICLASYRADRQDTKTPRRSSIRSLRVPLRLCAFVAYAKQAPCNLTSRGLRRVHTPKLSFLKTLLPEIPGTTSDQTLRTSQPNPILRGKRLYYPTETTNAAMLTIQSHGDSMCSYP